MADKPGRLDVNFNDITDLCAKPVVCLHFHQVRANGVAGIEALGALAPGHLNFDKLSGSGYDNSGFSHRLTNQAGNVRFWL